MNTFILNKKRTKSDIWKTWKRILIGYIEISKYLRIWAPCTHQVLIASKLIVNKGTRDADLLIKHPLLSQKSL